MSMTANALPLFVSLVLLASSGLSLQPTKSPAVPDTSRRELMGKAKSAFFTISAASAAATSAPHQAEAVYNPLNLKGTFWETGELYVKKETDLPADPDELLPSIKSAIGALESLEVLVLDGKFDDLSRQLRGGSVSESQLRLRGYALLDQLPDKEDEKSTYLAERSFRIFLTRFGNLDATVEAAARQSKIDGGLVETLGLAVVAPIGAANQVAKISSEPNLGSDARIQVLASLGDTTKALKAFAKAAEDALKKDS